MRANTRCCTVSPNEQRARHREATGSQDMTGRGGCCWRQRRNGASLRTNADHICVQYALLERGLQRRVPNDAAERLQTHVTRLQLQNASAKRLPHLRPVTVTRSSV